MEGVSSLGSFRRECGQNLEVAGHTAFTVRKQGEVGAGSQLAFSVPDSRPTTGWCHPYSEPASPPQLHRSKETSQTLPGGVF